MLCIGYSMEVDSQVKAREKERVDNARLRGCDASDDAVVARPNDAI